MNLFLDDDSVGFTKMSSIAAILSDTPDEWVQEIEQQLYRHLPFLSKYAVSVRLDAVEPQQGFAFGSADVRNKTDRMLETGEHDPVKSVNEVRIPVIVRERKLAPFDIFLRRSSVHPLTENRLSAAMFRPDVFDSTSDPPPDPILTNMLYPPSQGFYGYTNGGYDVSDKMAAILPAILDNLDPADVAHVQEALKDPSTAAGFEKNGTLQSLYALLARPCTSSKEKLSRAFEEMARASSVFQFSYNPRDGKFLVKHAQADAFEPKTDKLDKETATEVLGEDNVHRLESGGNITITTEPAIREDLTLEKLEIIADYGQWRVRTEDGRWLLGTVFPKLMDFSGVLMPLALFTNGSEHTIQDKIAGSRVGQGTNLAYAEPKGYGTLVYEDKGRAIATVPFKVEDTKKDKELGTLFHASNDLGEQFSFTFAPGLKMIAKTGEDEYAVPDRMRFLPITGNVTVLNEDPEVMTKIGGIMTYNKMIEFLSDGYNYSLRGGCGLDVLPWHERSGITKEAAVFLGAVVGIEPAFLEKKLQKIASGGAVRVIGGKELHPKKEKLAQFQQARESALSVYPVDFKQDTVKIAAVIEDPIAVDNILSLNFVTVDNVMKFIQRIPELERATTWGAEMLLASRLGLSQIPEEALERMLRAMDEVIAGLKGLAQRQQETRQ
jgi:hypothetical protein